MRCCGMQKGEDPYRLKVLEGSKREIAFKLYRRISIRSKCGEREKVLKGRKNTLFITGTTDANLQTKFTYNYFKAIHTSFKILKVCTPLLYFKVISDSTK